ncbi:Carboxylic ester hydrolase [Aphelenchoides besseyi]|nr:Carboxylic ester hydrolase [Aphelenchoides besseyi]
MKTIFLSIVLLFQLCIVVQATTIVLQDGSPIVGKITSTVHGKLVTNFYGIPFAEPPVGPLRFRKPKPKTPWRKPLNATVLPKSCIQSLDTYFGDFYGATMWNSNVETSEDCLYLNVYIPGNVQPDRKLAVMVWIYGGGFWSGCSTLDVYDASILAAEEEVIVVAMNYRVSLFGFLYLGTEQAPGNMGLHDQLLDTALKWVHANIDVFGGDPNRITLFGESAGAASVSLHMLSPRSTPYFHRAILQSGSATAPWAMENRQVALHRSVILYEYMKCGNMSHDPNHWDMQRVYRCLMEATPEKLRDAEWSPVMEFADFPWVPVVDGDFIVESPQTSLKQGHFKHTQLLAGSNLDEAIYFIVYQLADVFPPSDFFTKHDFIKSRDVWLRSISNLLPRQMLKSSLALQAIIHEYEPEGFPPEPQRWVDSLDKMLGDLQFTCNVNEFALAHSMHGGDTYYYYFTHRATQQVWPKFMGVLHGYEINFIFGEPYNTQRFNYTKEEQELSSRFMRYWANFARDGDPNKNKDGTYTTDTWPPYSSRTMDYMNLTVESDYSNGAQRIGHGPRRKECVFWKTLIPNILSASGLFMLTEVGESFIRWKQQMDRWENEYLVDWQYHFELYKKHQTYRNLDEQQGQCAN